MMDIFHGDCLDVMQLIPSNTFDSCVTDPPYNLESIKKRFGGDNAAPARAKETGVYARQSKGFMGKTWDSDVAFQRETWVEVYRVLKPGAHVVAFGGSRTYHRLACAIEDAGFEIRDQIMWLYGSGFPKSHNLDGDWEGWGTALKPAHEPIVLARKPLIGTVAGNVAAWGVGAINIDGCRVPAVGEALGGGKTSAAYAGCNGGWRRPFQDDDAYMEDRALIEAGKVARAESLGRFPANVIHDGSDEVLAAFPATKSGNRKAGAYGLMGYHGADVAPMPAVNGDSGSAARFFYCAKASRSDRNDGLAGFDEKPLLWSAGTANPGSFQSEGTNKAAQNPHPTVKPTDLMRYLCRLITPPGGHVLDPFLGSGSTGRGAVMEGFDFTGIEMTAEYVPIARARIAAVTPALGVFA